MTDGSDNERRSQPQQTAWRLACTTRAIASRCGARPQWPGARQV